MRFDLAERRIIFSRVFRTVSARVCARLWRLGAPSGGVDARREARPAFVRRRRRLRGPQLVRRRDVGVCGGCERRRRVAAPPSSARRARRAFALLTAVSLEKRFLAPGACLAPVTVRL